MRSRLAIAIVWSCASGCSILGSSGAGLNQRCERSLPAVDATLAITSGIIALAAASLDEGGPTGELFGMSVGFGASAFVGFSKASTCRARTTAPAPTTDRFVGARRWHTTTAVSARESPIRALERAFQRAAIVCEGRGFSALSSTPLQPRRPRRVTLTYRCH